MSGRRLEPNLSSVFISYLYGFTCFAMVFFGYIGFEVGIPMWSKAGYALPSGSSFPPGLDSIIFSVACCILIPLFANMYSVKLYIDGGQLVIAKLFGIDKIPLSEVKAIRRGYSYRGMQKTSITYMQGGRETERNVYTGLKDEELAFANAEIAKAHAIVKS